MHQVRLRLRSMRARRRRAAVGVHADNAATQQTRQQQSTQQRRRRTTRARRSRERPHQPSLLLSESDRLPPPEPPGDARGERAPSLGSAASAPSLSESSALGSATRDEASLRAAARWTVLVTVRPRRRRSEAAASRRVRCSAAVEGIPATRPPSDALRVTRARRRRTK